MEKLIYLDSYDNEINYSEFRKLEKNLSFKGFAIKHVVSETENYYIKNSIFKVNAGQYLLGNATTTSDVTINSLNSTKGICINIAPKVILEVLESYKDVSTELNQFLLTDNFMINTYNENSTYLGKFLKNFSTHVKRAEISNLNIETFYSLTEAIIRDQNTIRKHLESIDFKRKVTKEMNMRSVLLVKEFIDDNPFEDLNLNSLASIAHLSKYNLIRIFKSVFFLTPYQYVLALRLDYAKTFLLGGMSASSVSTDVGFSDLQSFSKAFKNKFGFSPSQLKK